MHSTGKAVPNGLGKQTGYASGRSVPGFRLGTVRDVATLGLKWWLIPFLLFLKPSPAPEDPLRPLLQDERDRFMANG
jgi:hypothetical protein